MLCTTFSSTTDLCDQSRTQTTPPYQLTQHGLRSSLILIPPILLPSRGALRPSSLAGGVTGLVDTWTPSLNLPWEGAHSLFLLSTPPRSARRFRLCARPPTVLAQRDEQKRPAPKVPSWGARHVSQALRGRARVSKVGTGTRVAGGREVRAGKGWGWGKCISGWAWRGGYCA